MSLAVDPADDSTRQVLCLLLLGAAWLGGSYAIWRLASVLAWRLWARIVVTGIALWLPFWDDVPGLIQYYVATRALGGIHTYHAVEADGYLDLHRHSALEVWGTLPASRYRYIEIHSNRRPLTSVTDPAYYELSLAQRGSPACAEFEARPTAAAFRNAVGLRDYCPVVVRRDVPVSRYVIESSPAWEPLDRYSWPRPLDVRWSRVVDRDGLAVLSEAYVFRYVPWLSTLGVDLAFEPISPETMADRLAGALSSSVIRPVGPR